MLWTTTKTLMMKKIMGNGSEQGGQVDGHQAEEGYQSLTGLGRGHHGQTGWGG